MVTLLKKEAWLEELREHPDQVWAELVVRGITEGFRIWYGAKRDSLQSSHSNMISAAE